MPEQITIREFGLESILVRRLEELKNVSRTEIIPFYMVFTKLCSAFSIKKQECWELLYFLRDRGIIEIVAFHGIRIF